MVLLERDEEQNEFSKGDEIVYGWAKMSSESANT